MRIYLASSGLCLVVFLIIHLIGLLLAVIAPISFELYASALHSASWLNWIEVLLLLIVLTHIVLTLRKVLKNSQSGNSTGLVSRRKDFLAVLAARSQPMGGVVLLAFILIHLEQLRFPRPPEGAELSTIHSLLASPGNLAIYIVGILVMFLHLFHGIESSQRSLGFLTPVNAAFIRGFGRGLSFMISAGFIVVTISLGTTGFLID